MTTLELAVLFFLRVQIVATAAILVVLALRAPARRAFGAELAYRLWALPPAAAVASLFPTVRQFIDGERMDGPVWPAAWIGWRAIERHAELLALAWSVGTLAMAGLILYGEWRFRQRVRRREAGPAVIGVSWPRLVTPHDYRIRFTDAERAFICEHERVHMARGHLKANLLIAILQTLAWFNPLVHLAAAGARIDQELACDAVVIERHPRERRQYAEAMLKAQVRDSGSPLACFMALHPLELRIKMLARKPVSLRRYLVGAGAISAFLVAGALLLTGLAPP